MKRDDIARFLPPDTAKEWARYVLAGGGVEEGVTLAQWVEGSKSAWARNNRLTHARRIVKVLMPYTNDRPGWSEETQFRWWRAWVTINKMKYEKRRVVRKQVSLSREELLRLFTAAGDDCEIRAAVAVGVGMGLKWTTARQLQTGDFHAAKGRVYVDLGGRVIKVPSWVWREVEPWVARRGVGGGYLFRARKGGRKYKGRSEPLARWGMTKRLQQLGGKAGVKVVGWVALTDTYARLVNEGGWDGTGEIGEGSGGVVLINKQMYNNLVKRKDGDG